MLSNAHHLFQMIFASDGWLLDARYKTFDMFTFSFYRFFTNKGVSSWSSALEATSDDQTLPQNEKNRFKPVSWP